MAPSNADVPTPVPFPHPDSSEHDAATNPNSPASPNNKRSRASTNASNTSVGNRIRTASIKLMETNPPPGFMAATGSVTSKAPSLSDIRKGSYGSGGWSDEPQRHDAHRRASQADENGSWLQRRTSSQSAADRPKGMQRGSSDRLKGMGVEPFPALTEEETSTYPTRETQVEGGVSQVQSYDDAHNGALKHNHVEENVAAGEKGRPSMERQVCLFPHPPVVAAYHRVTGGSGVIQ